MNSVFKVDETAITTNVKRSALENDQKEEVEMKNRHKSDKSKKQHTNKHSLKEQEKDSPHPNHRENAAEVPHVHQHHKKYHHQHK